MLHSKAGIPLASAVFSMGTCTIHHWLAQGQGNLAKYKKAGKEFSSQKKAFDKIETHAADMKQDGLALIFHVQEGSLRKQKWPVPSTLETIIS